MRSEMPEHAAAFAGNVAAFEQTVRSTLALAAAFGGTEWRLPTDCPGWSVQDVVAHMASTETLLLGADPAPGHTLPAELPHVRNELGRAMEPGVDARRSWPGPRVLAELADVLERRLAALAEQDPDEPTVAPTGQTVPYAEFMAFRAFDCWVHEQDIRRAVGRPGNLGAPGAEAARRIMTRGVPMIVGKRAGAAPGQTVAFEVGGDLPFTLRVRVDEDGRARLADAPAGGAPAADGAATTLAMDWEAFARLAAGRCGPADVTVRTTGDAALAGRILAGMALTP